MYPIFYLLKGDCRVWDWDSGALRGCLRGGFGFRDYMKLCRDHRDYLSLVLCRLAENSGAQFSQTLGPSSPEPSILCASETPTPSASNSHMP